MIKPRTSTALALFGAIAFAVAAGCSSDDSTTKADDGAAGAAADTKTAWEDM